MPIQVALHNHTFRRYLTAEAIAGRISKLAVELTDRLQSLPDIEGMPPLFLGILNGAVLFHSDLIRACDFELEVAYLRTRSYVGMESSGQVDIDWPAELDFAHRQVVIVEDIVDSGRTLATLTTQLQSRGVASLTTVVLLDKPTARRVDFKPDLVGFTIPDAFVVGYGLDYKGLGRNLGGVYQVE